jgi:hypothetical protein
MRTNAGFSGENVTIVGVTSRPVRSGVWPASCLMLAALCISTSPALAGLFDAQEHPRDEIARPELLPIRAHHKTKRNDLQIGKQTVPAGPLHIIVSIASQRVTLFSNGIRVAEAPISTGVAGHPTPMGIFSIISKARYHNSNIYSGAPMPYMHRITWSGIALHQGPLPGFPASHGCIRLPEAFAVKLWGISKVGARVIVTRDSAAPINIENAHLFVPKKPEENPANVAAATTPVMAVPTGPTAMVASSRIKDGQTTDQITDVTGTIVDLAPPADIVRLPEAPKPNAELQKRKDPVQVFVSRKESKLYVRQGFAPLFDASLTIVEPDKPWGTHVYTLMEIKDDTARWTSVTIPSGYARKPDADRHSRKRSAKEIEGQDKRAADLDNAPTAAQALERFELPKDAVNRISELLAPGSALIVSDHALSEETGLETGFIVVTK